MQYKNLFATLLLFLAVDAFSMVNNKQNIIKIGNDCTVFESNFLNTQKLYILNPQTKIKLSPQATSIRELYKRGVYMGSIHCWLGNMASGLLEVTDEYPLHGAAKKYKFYGTFIQFDKALSKGITEKQSLQELVDYFKQNLSTEVRKKSTLWDFIESIFEKDY